MKKFTINKNSYLNQDVVGYYNCDYTGYQQKGNPDFINRLKNMSKVYSEIDLVQDFIEVARRAQKDLQTIIEKENIKNGAICIIPRSKAENSYTQSQLMFKKPSQALRIHYICKI